MNISKILIVIVLLLTGCTSKVEYHLDLFYATTCPKCKLFREDVIPYLEDKYGNMMSITIHDIDKQESLDLYAKTISMLEDYPVNYKSASVPFIVFDGSFVKDGYDEDEKELLLSNIERAISKKKINPTEDYYLFKENMSIY